MAEPRVLFAGRHLEPFARYLEPDITVHRLWEAREPARWLAEIAPGLQAAATDAFTGFDAQMMRALPDLRLIANFGVGYDTTDIECAGSRGITVTNTPGVLDDDVADLAIGLMLSVCRKLPQGDAYVRAGKWSAGPFPLATKLTGKRLGILGLGRIGQAVAHRAAAFDMPISYHGRRHQPRVGYPYFDTPAGLAAAVDILVVLVPENDTTRGLVDRAVLDALGPQGILINVARGGVVDESALVDALMTGRLGGAGLDVFVAEPHVPEELLNLDNVVLQPHVGSATRETRQAMGELVIANLQAFFAGRPLLTPVN